MFRRREPLAAALTVYVDEAPVSVAAGDSVAVALLLAGTAPYRATAVGGTPRAPYCLIGNCFDCLVEIDGMPNRQGCLEPVRAGMRIRRQHGPARIET